MVKIDTWRHSEKPEAVKAFIGWGGVCIYDDSVNALDMIRAYIDKASMESCGQCFPCRSGLKKMAAILNRICEGNSQETDLKELQSLASLVISSARCDIGQTSPRPLLDLIEKHGDLFKNTNKIAKGNYAATVTAPCINACPSHVNIPDYLEKTRNRDFAKALESVLCDCAMPGTIGRVCVRPCEANCRRSHVDEALAIKSVKRFLADEDLRKNPIKEKSTKNLKEKVAIIGAGPAGLACAYYLANLGYKATIYEKDEKAGGMAKYGIPDYRLPADILAKEVDLVVQQGAEIKYGINIGQDKTMADLKNEGYKAIFIATGAPESSAMNCEGEEAGYKGFVSGVEFLKAATDGKKIAEGKKIAIIGGGNVAMDCVRTAFRLGFNDVNLLYRRTEKEMPADEIEILEAREEGVNYHFLVAPLKVLAKDGKVTGVLCQKMKLGEPDDSGRRRPVPIEGETFEIQCDVVIPAIGQVACVHYILEQDHQALSKWNTVKVDEITGLATDKENIFGGGDCVTGPDTLIAALAAGKRSAYYIAKHLEGQSVVANEKEKLEQVISKMGVFDKEEKFPYKGNKKKMALTVMDAQKRIKSFEEIEEGATIPQAAKEADRCLRCYRIALAKF